MNRREYTHHHDAAGGGGGGFHRSDFSFLPCPQSSITLKASCADLFVCSTSNSSPMSQPIFYYVCNPLTKQWAALPPAPQFKRNVVISTGFLCVPAPCSLCSTPQCVVGDNNNNNNFMVVRIGVIPSSIHSQFKFKAQLFSSEKGEWKSVVVSSPQAVRWFRLRSSKPLVPYKGMLHWLVSGFVLVYHPYNCPERFSRIIDMPIDMMAKGYRAQTIGLFQNRLRVRFHSDLVFYIWELEDYNMGKWSLVHKICMGTTLRPPRALPDPEPPHLHPIINTHPKIRETGFSNTNGSAFYWTNSSYSSGWWVANEIVHWITDQWWPTPVSLLTACTIRNNENTLENS